jgi:hypothetical protein
MMSRWLRTLAKPVLALSLLAPARAQLPRVLQKPGKAAHLVSYTATKPDAATLRC